MCIHYSVNGIRVRILVDAAASVYRCMGSDPKTTIIS